MPGPPCGNNPHFQLSPGDAQVVAEFRDFLTARAEEKKTVSDLDITRAALRPFEMICGTDRVERFEAAVRANERAGAEARRFGAPDAVPDQRAAQLFAPLEARARAILSPLDAKHRAKALREAADNIEARQGRLEAEERTQFGDLDHETVLQGAAVRDMAEHLRKQADQAQAKPWLSDSARIGHALIWSWTEAREGAFGDGYRAAQAEARAILTGERGEQGPVSSPS